MQPCSNLSLSKEARNLLDELITLAGFAPNYYESFENFDQRRQVLNRIAKISESAFTELEKLIEPDSETMTPQELSEYHENLNQRASEPLR